MICALCAAENPINGRFCLKCGALLQGQRAMPPQPGYPDAPSVPYVGPAETSGKAIGSLICGLLFFFFPISIVAIILGHLSLAEIRRSGGRLTGRGMAMTGLVLGYLGVSVIPILIIAAIAIPNLLRARIAANEASALGSTRTIITAELTYDDSYANGFTPSLESLDGASGNEDTCDHARLIDKVLASGQKNGYSFTYIPEGPAVMREGARARGCTRAGSQEFELHADPITRGTTGQRSFYADQTGVIRYSTQGPASAASPRLR
jgi:type IV pilus assembly protein PilA